MACTPFCLIHGQLFVYELFGLRMKSDNDTAILTTLGEIALSAHVIEDLLRLHLFDAGRFQAKGVQERTVSEIQDCHLKDLVSEFKTIYPEHARLAEGLDLIRQIRNKVFHAFCSDCGRDLLSTEGRDQIHALLLAILPLQRRHLKLLQRLHEELIREVCKNSFLTVIEKTNDWNAKTVAQSDLHKLVTRLRKLN